MTERGGGRRGPYAKTEARRSAIASACLELVIERGHADITLAEVAGRAGLTEATVSYHFPTKDLLFIAALEQADAADTQLSIDDDPVEADFAERLRRVVDAPAGHPNRLRLFTVEAANATDPAHPAHAWFSARAGNVRQQFAAILRDLQASGEAHPEVDPDRFARQMVAIWDGLQIEWLVSADFDLATEVAAAFRTLARADLMAARRAIEALAAEL